MVFREQTYSVLLVSAFEKFNTSTLELLPGSDFFPVEVARSVGDARRRISAREYDLVLINTPLPDDYGIKLAIDISASAGTCALLFVKSENYDDIYMKVVDSGVLVIAKPTSIQMVTHTLRILCAMRERLRQLDKKQVKVEDKISEIRIVNRAKWLLIEFEKKSEEEAHYYIEKEAMNQRVSKREIAERLIAQYE